jgi:hypothetical protein
MTIIVEVMELMTSTIHQDGYLQGERISQNDRNIEDHTVGVVNAKGSAKNKSIMQKIFIISLVRKLLLFQVHWRDEKY